jgi:thiamine-phosphate pyrophosphorylase
MGSLPRKRFGVEPTPLSSATDSPVLCYVTDRRQLADPSYSTDRQFVRAGGDVAALGDAIRRAIAGGVDWIQIREKDLSGRVLMGLVRDGVAAARGARTKIFVNERLDVAVAAGAAGVHLGGEALPVRDVARWRDERPTRGETAARDFWIGASCHSLAEAEAAESDGANYVIFGPVFETPAKLKFGAPQGVAKLRAACERVKIPVLAIGGVSIENAGECVRAGAAGIAAIRLFQDVSGAEELRGRIRRLRGAV